MKNSSALKRSFLLVLATVAISAMVLNAIGCGGSEPAKKDDAFFTSGDREADQRADQRINKEQQLKDSKAPGAKTADTPDANASLYTRLGGDDGISKVVDDFLPRVMADPRVNFERKGVSQGGFSFHRWHSEEWDPSSENVANLKKHFIQFVALATGGPSIYDGKDIKGDHGDMHISNPEFDAALGDLKASLDKLGIPVKEQKELLSIIESTRPEIVTER